jgi:Domain of unknown function (DUF4351)
MFFYFARLHQKYLERIYPIVLFSFDEPFREEPQRYAVEFDDLKVMEFNFCSIQLNRLNWRDYLNQRNPVAAALMAKMRIDAVDRPRVKVECLRLLATLRLNPAKSQLISGFVDTYLRLNEPEEKVFQAQIGTLEAVEREDIMQIVTSWMEQGIEQGAIREARSLVLRQLTRRIGQIAPAAEAKILTLSVSQLESLGEALLDFVSPKDLDEWLRSQNISTGETRS